MDTNQQPTTGARVLGPKDGEVAGAPESRTDRFMLDSKDTGGGLSVGEPTLPTHVVGGAAARWGRCGATRRSSAKRGIWSSSLAASGTPSGTLAIRPHACWSSSRPAA